MDIGWKTFKNPLLQSRRHSVICFAYMVFKTVIEQLKATASLENIAGYISCEDNTKMTSRFRLDTITP